MVVSLAFLSLRHRREKVVGKEGRVACALRLEAAAGPWRPIWLAVSMLYCDIHAAAAFKSAGGASAGHETHGWFTNTQDRQQRDGEVSVQAAASCLASLLAAHICLVSYHSIGAATDSAPSSFTCGSQEAGQAPRNVFRHALDLCLCP